MPAILFILLAFSPILFFNGVWAMSRVWQARQILQRQRRWPTTYGRVLSAEVEPVWLPGERVKRRFQAQVSFEYTVDGQTYTATAQPAQAGFTPFAAQAREKATAHYPPGQTVLVHYNPAQPSQASLPRQVEWLPDLIVGLVGVVGGGLLLGYAVVTFVSLDLTSLRDLRGLL